MIDSVSGPYALFKKHKPTLPLPEVLFNEDGDSENESCLHIGFVTKDHLCLLALSTLWVSPWPLQTWLQYFPGVHLP